MGRVCGALRNGKYSNSDSQEGRVSSYLSSTNIQVLPALFVSEFACFMLTDNMDQQQRLSLIKELETLIHVGRHPNIVSLVGACTFEGRVVQQTAYSF